VRDTTRLSQNFYRYEFACPCGCGFQTADVELVTVLQRLRDHYEKPVYLTERGKGARCETFNAEVGGYPKSRHLRGEAADFSVDRIPAHEVQALLRRWYPEKYGIGRGQSFTHVDVRPNAANWSY
jgi:uncharacterized protein YcbK (DUF882 family)